MGKNRISHRYAVVLLASLLAVLYLLSFASILTEDSSAYAYAILIARTKEALFHPHHILYNPLMAILLYFFQLHLPSFASLYILQAVNILISIAVVVVFFNICLSYGASVRLSLPAALVLGTSNFMVRYASEIEVYQIALLCLLMAFLLSKTYPPMFSCRTSMAIGIFFLLAMAFHQTSLFFAAPLIVLIACRVRTLEKTARAYVEVLFPLCLIAIIYMVIARYMGMKTPKDLLRWLTLYSHGNKPPSGGVGDKLFLSCIGFANTLFPLYLLKRIYSVLLVGALALVLLPSRPMQPRMTLRSCGTHTHTHTHTGMSILYCWILPYSIFTFWWNPGNPEFWIMIVPAVILSGLIAGAHPGDYPRKVESKTCTFRLAVIILLLLLGDALYGAANVRRARERQSMLDNLVNVINGDIIVAANSEERERVQLYAALLDKKVQCMTVNEWMVAQNNLKGSTNVVEEGPKAEAADSGGDKVLSGGAVYLCTDKLDGSTWAFMNTHYAVGAKGMKGRWILLRRGGGRRDSNAGKASSSRFPGERAALTGCAA